ncbi:MAG: ATP phosphoribosyltransferase regulatory subunit, partial [Lachnospiraceae bacterium]
YQIEKYITFDLSMSGNYLYYTGIIFRGYTYGTGDAIVKGGRYDGLLEKFGKAAPSIGFAIVIDEVMSALSRQKIEIPCGYENTLIVYEPMRQEEAISLAREFREQENKAELLKKETDKTLEEYAVYGKENFAGNMIYLNDNQEIRMMNLLTGECKNAVGQEKENEEKSL